MEKKIILIITLLFVSLGLPAQTKSFRDFYDKYSGRDGYTTIQMSGEMFKAIGSNVKINTDAMDVSSMINQIKNMMIIITDRCDEQFAKDVQKMVRSGNYVAMTTVKDGSQTSQFFTVKKDGKTTEFLMTVLGEGDNVIMSIVGENLDVSQISKLAREPAGD